MHNLYTVITLRIIDYFKFCIKNIMNYFSLFLILIILIVNGCSTTFYDGFKLEWSQQYQIEQNVQYNISKCKKVFEVLDQYAAQHQFELSPDNSRPCYRRYFNKSMWLLLECAGSKSCNIFHIRFTLRHVWFKPRAYNLDKTDLIKALHEHFPDLSFKIIEEPSRLGTFLLQPKDE